MKELRRIHLDFSFFQLFDEALRSYLTALSVGVMPECLRLEITVSQNS